MNRFRLAALALLTLPAAASAADGFALKPGDRVVFYGDSITDQRLYTTFTETFVVTRFPRLNVTFVHSGWGGDRVSGGAGGPVDLRLQRDVLAYKPTVVTVMLGMNDASYQPFKPDIFDAYARGYEHLVATLRKDAPDARLTLIVPSPFDDVTRPPAFEGGYNGVLVRYGDFVKELAGKNQATVADLNTPVVEATKKAFVSDPEHAKDLNPDRVHPASGGQLLMAEALLKAWQAPAVVSSVSFTVQGTDLIAKAKGATVTGPKFEGTTLTWSQLDEALPFPLSLNDPATALAVQSSDIVAALDQQPLVVTGLAAGDYALSIDGKEVGVYTADALAKGVNLALEKTPMVEQARKVHARTLQHNNLHYTRWRMVEVPLAGETSPQVPAALQALDAVEADLVAKQRAEAQPVAHAFALAKKP